MGWPELLRHRTALILGIACVAGALLGWLVLPLAPTARVELPPEVHFLSAKLALGDDAKEEALGRARRFVTQRFGLVVDGELRELSMAALGVEIDKVRLSQLVRDARDPTSPMRRQRSGSERLELPSALSVNGERAVEQLLRLKDALDKVSADARLDLEKRVVLPEVHGRLLDVDATLSRIRQALERGGSKAEAVFEVRKPRRLAKDLGGIDFGQVLGSFQTRYNRSVRYEARTYNLRLAASKLDGVVLMPGEVFDFNEVVGPRDEANGYKVAKVIAEGELVDGIGGGTCQISGTLHGAAFFAGLEIVERYPHTRPSSYIKMGLDATVVYPTINFRLRNPFDFPVVLRQTVRDGRVEAQILGPRRARTVTLIRRIESVQPYEQVERPDDKLPQGARVLSQRGVPGFKLRRYRLVREGAHVVRERFAETYPPTAQVIRVGTADPRAQSGPLPADDPTPEYLADEVLVMTLDKGDDIDEQREPGRFGERGWTKAAGMPFWESQERTHEPESESTSKSRKGLTNRPLR